MKTVDQSGRSGSGILVSDGADLFDPDSMLDEPSEPPKNKTSLIVLTVAPPVGIETLQVGGFFEGMKAEKRSLSLEMTVLLPLATELGSLTLMSDPTTLESILFLTPEQSEIRPQELQLHSVQFGAPLNNRVKMTVLFKPYEHH